MTSSLDFLPALLARERPVVSGEDLAGPHAALLAACAEAGFLDREAGCLPVPSCPHCAVGEPYDINGVLVCGRCRSRVDAASQSARGLHVDRFLGWVAACLGLRGGVRRAGPHVWHLGTAASAEGVLECFYAAATPDPGERRRLDAYRAVVLLHGPGRVETPARLGLRAVPLTRLLVWDAPRLAVRPLDDDSKRSAVAFDADSGVLRAGGRRLGEVPVGSHECHLLACLAERPDRYVAYEDLRREVLRRGGGRDGRDAATFCQEVKRRIKRKFIPDIDRVVTTNKKAAGYRLRAAITAEEPTGR